MEIQGDLIALDTSDKFPVPWQVRAHLGLKSKTSVSLFLTHPQKDQGRVPDVILTPLSAHKLQSTFTVEIETPERLGAVRNLLRKISNRANIVLSDTITLEGRSQHRINLVVEPVSERAKPKTFGEQILVMLTRDGELRRKDIRMKPVYESPQNLSLIDTTKVDDAYFELKGWREKITRDYPRDAAVFDLSVVVASSNPDQRLIRYIFPRQGAAQLKVPHYNGPGTLREILRAITSSGYNILSSRLSRSPSGKNAPDWMSVFYAVCEPAAGAKAALPSKLREAVQALPDKYLTKNASLEEATPAHETRYVKPRRARLIEPPVRILSDIDQVRDEAAEEYRRVYGVAPRRFIFLSYRFVAGHPNALVGIRDEHESTLEIIRKSIRDMQCQVLEAPQSPGQTMPFVAVHAPIYAAHACLVLALNELGKGTPSPSQGHEYGFFCGQRRPVRMVVENRRFGDVRDAIGNIDGQTLLRYAHPGGRMTDVTNNDSAYVKVREFLKDVIERPDFVTV
jgi:hypothetical protein